MGFRDDNEALRQRVQALEGEVETLTEELEASRTPKVRVEPELHAPDPVPHDADLAARIAAEEAAREHEKELKRRREAEAKAERARGKREAKITIADGTTHVELKRSVSTQLRKKLQEVIVGAMTGMIPALWVGMFLERWMPTVQAMQVGAVLTGLVCLAGVLVYLWLGRPQMELRIADGNFELKNRGKSRMIGCAKDLRISVSAPSSDGRMAGSMDVRANGDLFRVEGLGLADTEALDELSD